MLSTLFGINALKIPLFAPPGKAPELKKGWGYVNLSHCSDALLIGWSPHKIGVDIERSDRAFNSSALAKKMFTDKEKIILKKKNNEKSHKTILTKWVAKEAATKWQRGSLFQDLNQWESCDDSTFYFHRSNGYKVFIDLLDLKSWTIAIAYNKEKHMRLPIICLE